MILPLPIIIIITSFSICLTNISQPVKKGQKCYLKSSNDEIYKVKLLQNHSNEQGDMGELSPKTCISIHTHMEIFFLAVFLYECYFDFVCHLPIESLLLRIILATIFRVQFSLIIISTYLLPEKIVSSLVSIYRHENIENNFPKKNLHQDSFSNLFHILRFRTKKHKKQKLVLRKNWKSTLKRISYLKKKSQRIG